MEDIQTDEGAPKRSRRLRKPSSRSSRKDQSEEEEKPEENDVDSVIPESVEPVEVVSKEVETAVEEVAPKSSKKSRKPSSRSSRKDQAEEEKPEENDAVSNSVSSELKEPAEMVTETENVDADAVSRKGTRKRKSPSQSSQKDLHSEITQPKIDSAEENMKPDEPAAVTESSDPFEVEDVADPDETETQPAASGRAKRTRKADPDSGNASSRSKRAKKNEPPAADDTETVSKATGARSTRPAELISSNQTDEATPSLSPVVRLTRCKMTQGDSVSESGSRKRALKATVSEEKPAEPAPKKKAGRPKKVPEKAVTGSSQSTDDGVEAPVPKQESPSKSRNRRRRRRTSSGKLKPSTDNSDL